MRAVACATLLALLATPAAFAAESANYTNLLHVFSGGGGNATSASYIMDGCIGQAAIGETVDTSDADKKSVSWFAPVFFGMPFRLTLDYGYTLAALPCYPKEDYTSQTLLEAINAEAGSTVCTTV